jgi:cytidine deaminase
MHMSNINEEIISRFPPTVQRHLTKIPDNGGVLRPEQIDEMLSILGIEIGELMVRLLPIAAAYAIVPISNFKVGAVAQGVDDRDKNSGALYLGANLEFIDEALSIGLHAEQSAAINAWMAGESGISRLALSAPPCGYCRQFLYELASANNLLILLPNNEGKSHKEIAFSKLLPEAFGPADLGTQAELMKRQRVQPDLKIFNSTNDDLVRQALQAATESYVPYTKGYAGCAIQTTENRVFLGRYAENAAYNPSISPLHTALSVMNLSYPVYSERKLIRAVLVEAPQRTSQRSLVQQTLRSFAPEIELEYHKAEQINATV